MEGKSPWHLFEILSLVWQALYVITKTGKDSIHVLTQISEQQNIQRTISDTLEFEISIIQFINSLMFLNIFVYILILASTHSKQDYVSNFQ